MRIINNTCHHHHKGSKMDQKFFDVARGPESSCNLAWRLMSMPHECMVSINHKSRQPVALWLVLCRRAFPESRWRLQCGASQGRHPHQYSRTCVGLRDRWPAVISVVTNQDSLANMRHATCEKLLHKMGRCMMSRCI